MTSVCEPTWLVAPYPVETTAGGSCHNEGPQGRAKPTLFIGKSFIELSSCCHTIITHSLAELEPFSTPLLSPDREIPPRCCLSVRPSLSSARKTHISWGCHILVTHAVYKELVELGGTARTLCRMNKADKPDDRSKKRAASSLRRKQPSCQNRFFPLQRSVITTFLEQLGKFLPKNGSTLASRLSGLILLSPGW